MEYVLIYLLLGVLVTGLFHVTCTSAKIPFYPRSIDYFIVTFFYPIIICITIYTIFNDTVRRG